MAVVWESGIMFELLCIWQVLHEKYSISGFFFVWEKMNYVELLCVWQVLRKNSLDSWIEKNELC